MKDCTDIKAVRDAMAQTGMNNGCWWGKPEVNGPIMLGVGMGWLLRQSTTQVEWAEAGILESWAARAYEMGAERFNDKTATRNPDLCQEFRALVAVSELNKIEATETLTAAWLAGWDDAQAAAVPIRTLTCCCCGEPTKGRQWHNRDAGYGLCRSCAGINTARYGAGQPGDGLAGETTYAMAGVAGYHHSLEGPAMIDRSEAAKALAKAIAYKNCGKDQQAEEWAAKLVRLLECADILK